MAKEEQTPVVGEHPSSGAIPEMVNSPLDCPTIFVEGSNGIIASPYMVKVHFSDHFPVEEGVKGRFVVTLAMPTEQFLKVAASLKEAADQIEAATTGKDAE